jgi:hypothetical protein
MKGVAAFKVVAIPILAEFEANPSDYGWPVNLPSGCTVVKLGHRCSYVDDDSNSLTIFDDSQLFSWRWWNVWIHSVLICFCSSVRATPCYLCIREFNYTCTSISSSTQVYQHPLEDRTVFCHMEWKLPSSATLNVVVQILS